MIKSLGFLLLLSTASISAVAQSDFRAGYIVQAAGDTVSGLVAYQGAQRSALLCRFRSDAQAAVVEYQPEQLRGYGFKQGTKYLSQPTPAAPARAAFFEILASGKVSLLTLVDSDDQRHFYVQSEAASVVELIQKDTIVSKSSPSGVQKVKVRSYPFRNVLNTTLAGCPAVQAQLGRAELVESQLTKLVNSYNNCATGAPAQVAAPRAGRFKAGLLVGAQRSAFTFNDEGEEKMSSTVGPLMGIGLDFAPARFNEKLSMRVEGLYSKQSTELQYTRPGSGPFLTQRAQRNLEVDVTSLHLVALLRYARATGAIRPFIQAGPQLAAHIKSNAVLTTTYDVASPPAPSSREIDLRPSNFGGVLGAGLLLPAGKVGTFQLEARLDMMDSLSESGILSGATTTSVLVGYTIGK
ncbi:outer membrane beta-barrel protein [Hymenobacter sp. HDW8]|uniref:outer membrane beta-barrel protein n=1 Tax=Hymenobacter sp. HDW8 TaxID=2714932 RepID=UPI001408E04C|nr:outer membrane beta-barrel protein [Hymenobacter sp. HDW8]QIL75725.1 PorT family protein [Hymenobacter sp. HDW8]